LDDSGLTLGDIKSAKESFIKTLKGRFHVRVRYPGNEEFMIQPPNVPRSLLPGTHPPLIGGQQQEEAP
jgi:hypothetical protein